MNTLKNVCTSKYTHHPTSQKGCKIEKYPESKTPAKTHKGASRVQAYQDETRLPVSDSKSLICSERHTSELCSLSGPIQTSTPLQEFSRLNQEEGYHRLVMSCEFKVRTDILRWSPEVRRNLAKRRRGFRPQNPEGDMASVIRYFPLPPWKPMSHTRRRTRENEMVPAKRVRCPSFSPPFAFLGDGPLGSVW